MARENRDMEKKVTSSPARLTSCDSKGKDNGRGNGNKTQRYSGKSKRDLPQGRNPPPDSSNGQSRRPAPQKSRAMDKRPRSRGLPASRRDEVTVAHRAEIGSALPQGPKKLNLNHLINFTFAPREAEDGRGGGGIYRGRRWSHRHPRFNKEQFLQANCQFVVKSSGDYKQQCVDPDTLVDWDLIEQVRMLGHEMPSCPICLFPPAAAKITKCGHIYCWPCILHYLSLGEKKWRKCPICYESVMANDLKSVVAKSLKTFSVGDSITMRLMKREKGSVVVQPHDPEKAPAETPTCISPSLTDVSEETTFAKLMVASPSEVKEKILLREQRELEQQLKESIDDFEKSFIQRALDSLKERDTQLHLSSEVSRTSVSVTQLDDQQAPAAEQNAGEEESNVSSISIPSKEDCIVYASAFSDEEQEEDEEKAEEEKEEEKSEDVPATIPDDEEQGAVDNSTHPQPPGAVSDKPDQTDQPDSQDPPSTQDHALPGSEERDDEIRTDEEKEEEDGEKKGAEKESPKTGAGRRERKTSSNQGSVYFYQAEDGQHLYLGSLNARCLTHEYGGLEHAPLTITAKLVEIEHVSITQDMRNRLRHLHHLPLTCEVCVCELAVRPPTLSAKTLAYFAPEIQKKRQRRDKKARDEKRRERKIKQEEDRKNGVSYPKPRFSLQSTRQFPSFSPGAPESTGPPRPTSPAASVESGASSNYSAPLSEVHDIHEDELVFGHPHVEQEWSSQPASVSASPPGDVAGGGWPSVGSPDHLQGGQRSFAQMLRDGAAKPGSPMKSGFHTSPTQHMAAGGASGKTPGREANSSNESENEDYVPVPHYKDAFSNAIQDALDKAAATMSLKKDDELDGVTVKSGGGGGRKNKKGRKKQLLFSTAGPRFK